MDLSAAFAVFPVLETERFVLREITPEDAPELFRIYGDPEVMRYFGSPPIATLEEARQRVERTRVAFRNGEGIRWAITRRGSPQMIGSCGHWRLVKPHFRSEIGYDLLPEAWGQGVMPEAVAAILQFGFERMGLHSVEAQIHPDNRGSRRVLEKLGFVQEGYFRESYYENGVFTDAAVFSLLGREWAGKRGIKG